MVSKVNLVMTLKENDKFYAVAETIDGGQNLMNRLSDKKIVTANVCKSRKRAEEIAAHWNECYKNNGTYLLTNEYFKNLTVAHNVVKGDTSSFEEYIPSNEAVEALENLKEINNKTIDVFVLSQILHEIKGDNPDIDSKEMMFLAERLHEACSASQVAIDRGERIWALADLLSEGISDRKIYNRYIDLPETSPEKIKEVLLNCEMDDFIDLIDYIAIQNIKYFLDDPTVEYFYESDVTNRLNDVVKANYKTQSLDNVIKAAEQSKTDCSTEHNAKDKEYSRE